MNSACKWIRPAEYCNADGINFVGLYKNKVSKHNQDQP